MRLKFFIVLFLFSLSPLSFSDNYYRGNYSCEGFQEMEQLYKSRPGNIHARMGYAQCLIVMGKNSEGLSILYNIAEKYNNVEAPFIMTEYIHTDGKFDSITIDESNINEAIEAYGRVLFFINLDPRYPYNGNDIYEKERQMELVSYYNMPRLYFKKFMKGAQGTDNIHLLRSASYRGERGLNTYPEYSPYTIDSLNKMINFADQCLALPLKQHFKPDYYKEHKAACQILKDVATALLPLEEKRLVLLSIESCSSDLSNCSDHYEVKDEIVSVIRQATSKINAIFG